MNTITHAHTGLTKYIRFSDGRIVELSPVTYEEFIYTKAWYGRSELAFATWKQRNHYVEITDYVFEELVGAEVVWLSDSGKVEVRLAGDPHVQ